MTRFAISLVAGISALALASAANAADLIIEQPAVGVVQTTSGGWEGAFVGVFAGYGWGTATDDDAVGIFPTSTDDTLDLAGWLVGADVGYNFYLSDGIVGGIVADLAWSDINGEDTAGGPTTAAIDWAGSLRARLGFDGGAFMPYLTGGLAVAGATVNDGTEDTATHIGWTVGAGVEIAATEDLSIDLQYRYSDYGSQDYALSIDPTPVSLTNHQVTAGLHWNF